MRLKANTKPARNVAKHTDKYGLFIIEDDPDQMALLVNMIRDQISVLSDGTSVSAAQIHRLQSIQIVKVSNLASLKNALRVFSQAALVLSDCNLPDDKGLPAHDQLVKHEHKITGQHQVIEQIMASIPNTPITMISSMNRFQTVVYRYYQKRQEDADINFINKSDLAKIERNVRYYLRRFLNTADKT